MSERRQYSRGEWISAAVFMVVVLVVAASCWPSGSGSSSSGVSVSGDRPAANHSSDVGAAGDGLPVTASRFTEWPFTVGAGILQCEAGAVTFEPPGGPRYAVNGTAKDAGYPEIMPIWADDKELGNGLKVNISEVLNKGLSLC